MYMPGRCRTGSSPLRTVMSCAVYEAWVRVFVAAREAFVGAVVGLAGALAEVVPPWSNYRPEPLCWRGFRARKTTDQQVGFTIRIIASEADRNRKKNG